MIKVIVQEEIRRITNNPQDDDTTYWETKHEMMSADRKVIAGALRAMANQYDPPEKTYR